MRKFLQSINILNGIYIMVKKTFTNAIRRFWCQTLITTLILATILITCIGDQCTNSTTKAVLENLNLLTAPLLGVFGLILGYPLLKRKLLDGYITKMFEDVHNNNKRVKKECLRLSEKYPIRGISTSLTNDYLAEVILNMKNLSELTIDSNVEVYKYTTLVYKALCDFQSKSGGSISLYYCETISSLINKHLAEIYKYSQSLGAIPKNNMRSKPILRDRLRPFVSDNRLYEVENNCYSLSYNHTSAQLVVYYGINLSIISDMDGKLFKSCFTVAPSPSPIVRLMYNSSIYIPPILEGQELFLNRFQQLYLVGYKRKITQKFGSPDKAHYYIAYYANISSAWFVSGTMKTKESLNNFNDIYIDSQIVLSKDVSEYNVDGEIIKVRIDDETVKRYFCNVKKKLCDKMKQEMKY